MDQIKKGKKKKKKGPLLVFPFSVQNSIGPNSIVQHKLHSKILKSIY